MALHANLHVFIRASRHRALPVNRELRLLLLGRTSDAERIRTVWSELTASCSALSYFQSWGWIETWLGSLPESINLRLAVVEEKGRPLLAFFLGSRAVKRHGFVRSAGLFLNATGEPVYDALCPEYNQAVASDGAQLSLAELMTLLPSSLRWDELFLPALNAQVFPGNAVAGTLSDYDVRVEKEVPSPYVDLSLVRRTQSGYLSLISSNSRHQIRHSYKLYKPRGEVTCEAARSVPEALGIYDELVGLHQKSWMDRGIEGCFSSRYFLDFHKTLIKRRFEAGEIQLLRVRCGTDTVGCLYNFVLNGRIHFYQSGIRYEQDSKLKPGLVSHVEGIQHNARLGHGVYDFLAGDSQYKESLATHKGRMIWAVIQKRRPTFWLENELRRLKRLVFAGRGEGQGGAREPRK